MKCLHVDPSVYTALVLTRSSKQTLDSIAIKLNSIVTAMLTYHKSNRKNTSMLRVYFVSTYFYDFIDKSNQLSKTLCENFSICPMVCLTFTCLII